MARLDTEVAKKCAKSPQLWNQAVVCMTGCDAYLNNYTCEHCLVARSLEGDPSANVTPSALAVATTSGRPLARVRGSARESEEAAEDKELKRRRLQAPASPPRNAAAELAMLQIEDAYKNLSVLCRVLLAPTSDRCVLVPRGDGKKALTLCNGLTAFPILEKLRLAIEQANGIREWNWKQSLESLGLIGCLRFYKLHPAPSVSGVDLSFQGCIFVYLRRCAALLGTSVL
jgi:hypothetical protein